MTRTTRTPQTDAAALPLEAVERTIEAMGPETVEDLVHRVQPAPLPMVGDMPAGDLVQRHPQMATPITMDQADQLRRGHVMTPAQAPTPMVLLSIAMDQGADLDRLERLMEMQERWEANEARKAFAAAFAAFKAEAVTIVKSVTYTDGPLKGRKYADLFCVVDTATAALSKHGLSASWRLTKDDRDWLEVTCTLRHLMGHSETVAMGGPPDTGGAKSPIQARASSVAYLERYTFLAITGLAARDEDRDGRPPQAKPEVVTMPEAEFQNHLARIKGAKDDEALKAAYTAAVEACHRQDKDTIDAFGKAKNDRYRALHPKAQPQGGAR